MVERFNCSVIPIIFRYIVFGGVIRCKLILVKLIFQSCLTNLQPWKNTQALAEIDQNIYMHGRSMYDGVIDFDWLH